MSDYEALLLVIAIIAAAGWAAAGFPGLRTWRRCRCGAHFCTGCGRQR